MTWTLAVWATAWAPILGPGVLADPHAHHQHQHRQRGGYILPPGPGLGWSFPNGAPDVIGWADYGVLLPITPDGRNPNYYFPRAYAVPADQLIMGTYYNPYVMRGQRYIPYTGDGSAVGPPAGSALTPTHPYASSIAEKPPQVTVPRFNGETQAPPANANASGLTP